jgi:HD-like signal output (HDOD) protein
MIPAFSLPFFLSASLASPRSIPKRVSSGFRSGGRCRYVGHMTATVRKLMLELTLGDIRLPSFPDIAIRVQKVLDDPRTSPARVAVVVGSEAALAARILRLANSAFLNPSGEPVNDLRIALTRLGVQLTRCTAVSFALQQMKLGGGDAALRPELQELWRSGALVASIAYVLARESRAANPDEALVTGLMHNIGRLYITVSAPRGESATTGEAWAEAVREWHPQIAVLILKHWKFAPAIIAAVGSQNAGSREGNGDDRLTDILTAAMALVPCVFDRAMLCEIVASIPAFQRLKLAAEDCTRILAASADQIRSLRAGLCD